MDNGCASAGCNHVRLVVPAEILRRKSSNGINALKRWLGFELMHQGIFGVVEEVLEGQVETCKTSEGEVEGREIQVFYRDS